MGTVKNWEVIMVSFLLQSFMMLPAYTAELPLQVHTSYKLVSGLLMERVPTSSSYFYQEYVPLVYQFTVPRWSKPEMMIYGSQNCTTSNYTKFFTTCPMLYYLGELHERFTEFFLHNQPLVVNLQDINAKPEGSQIPLDCELVKPHFEDTYVDKAILEEYLARLKSCSSLGSQEFIQGISNYLYNISGVYLEMRRNFYSEYWLKIDLIDGRVDAAIWANAISTLNALLFENHLMESNRWKAAVMDCEAGRIPSTILPPALLSDTLNDMVESLVNQGLIPTVSAETIGNYYKASLTDCTFTNDTFLVRILVPVIPKTENFLLLKVSPAPFYYKNKDTREDLQCEVDPAVLPSSTQSGDDTYALVDMINNIAYESDCKPGQLCHIPTALHPRKVSPCLTAAFIWERERGKGKNGAIIRKDLIKYCPIKCSPISKSRKGALAQITPFEFLWFNGDNSNIDNPVVNCSSLSPVTTGANFLIHSAMSRPFGAQTIEINCHCRIIYKSRIYKAKPCNTMMIKSRNQDVVQVTHVAPIQWYPNEVQQQTKEFWNVAESIYKNLDTDLIWKGGHNPQIQSSLPLTSANSSSPITTAFLAIVTILCFGLMMVVLALALRLRALIVQLERSGFNVRGTYSVSNSVDGASQQVSYRNMSSLVDTDSLLFNDGNQ